ncbi:MAG: hypothetical protein AB7G93_05305 [Bdellovibrionales bacterium]
MRIRREFVLLFWVFLTFMPFFAAEGADFGALCRKWLNWGLKVENQRAIPTRSGKVSVAAPAPLGEAEVQQIATQVLQGLDDNFTIALDLSHLAPDSANAVESAISEMLRPRLHIQGP